MIVLGYNGFTHSAAFADAYFGSRGIDRNLLTGHDAGAALFKDGVLVAAAEEERFTRCKKTSAFPENALQYCLKEAGCSVEDVDYIAVPWDFSEEWISTLASNIFQGQGSFSDKLARFEKQKSFYLHVASHEKMREDFNGNMGTDFAAEQFVFVPHHLAHMFCGFFLSGMEASAFLVTDGRGERYSSIMGEINRDGYEVFDTVSIADSIGILYRQFTRYLGFTPNSDEWKVMALGAFVDAPPAYDVEKFLTLLPNGRFKVRVPGGMGGHSPYYRFFDDYFGGQKDESTFRKMGYIIQDLAEKAIWHQVSHLQNQAESDLLFLEGGVALNCVNNAKILAKSKFQDVRVSFAANDTGTCIGAAFFPFYQQRIFKSKRITPYLGPAFSDEDIQAALEAKPEELVFREEEEHVVLEEVAAQLADKKIIGWFQGRMELGPRALGNRSILASPAFSDMKDIINAKVKYREAFRPFAGVSTELEAERYFDLGKKKNSPFMTFVFSAKHTAQEQVASSLHVDGTSRLQTVSVEQNFKLHRLLTVFGKKTGTSCLINTSFNVQGEPIVCTPEDAVKCFLKSGIDILVMGNCIAYKR